MRYQLFRGDEIPDKDWGSIIEFAEEYISDYNLTKNYFDFMTSRQDYFYGIYYGGRNSTQVCGGVVITESNTEGIWISFIYVQEEFRRRGIASGMLEEIKDFAFLNNYGDIRAGIDLNNSGSLKLFDNMGYRDKYTVKEIKL